MASPTKQAIVASFLRLVAKKSPDKITVRDIVDDCGVNRNTFYYYFQDIYAVMEELCNELFDSLPTGEPLVVTITHFYARVATFCNERPAAARSIALSLGYEGLDRYLGKNLEGLMLSYFLQNELPPPSTLQLRITRHAILGLCLDVMRGGKTPAPTVEELGELLLGQNSPLPMLGGNRKDRI